ncbi:MAG: hypothetical protein M3139_00315 [Bacteroidota bacterium]|nr:hypothetical protein [Bacteroidota bacterium]
MDVLQNNKPQTLLQSRLKLGRWGDNLLLLYIITMPFVSAFAFTNIISLPLIIALLLLILMIIEMLRAGKLPKDFAGFDLVIVGLFLFLDIFSYAVNGWGNAKSLNHTVAYLATFLLFYVPIKFILFNTKDDGLLFRRVLQFVTYTTIISAVYANLEFISSNLFRVNLNNYIPRPSEEQAYYDATVLGIFYRARGFTAESGHFTFMMELFSPVAIYYMYFSGFCKWWKTSKAFIIFLIVCSFIFAVSTASFVIVPIAVLLACLLHVKKIFIYLKKRTAKFLFTSAVIAAIVFLFNYFFSVYALILLSISDKMNNGYDYRQQNIDFYFTNFFKMDIIKEIIGSGPAGVLILGYDQSTAILNLYYSVAFELGLLGLFLLLALLLYVVINILKINSSISFFLLISFLSGAMHYYFISNFWYPWFWFIMVFAIFCRKKFSSPSQVLTTGFK